MRLSPRSHKLLSRSVSDSSFNYIMAQRSTEARWCTYLASDHRKVNCAINLPVKNVRFIALLFT